MLRKMAHHCEIKITQLLKIKAIKCAVLFCTLCASAPLALAESDVLAPAKSVIEANLGSSSTIWWILLVIEGVLGVIAYLKTKALTVLIGVPVVMMFTTILWKVIGN